MRTPALCVARCLVFGWTWLYTMAVPAGQRAARRAEVLSDMHDQVVLERERDIAPVKTAFHVVARMFSGSLDDVAWSVPFLPTSLAEYLARASDATDQIRVHPLVIPSLATLGTMNLWLTVSGLEHRWFDWALANGGVLLVALFLLDRQRVWARVLSRSWGAFVVALAVGTVVCLVAGLGSDRMPEGYQLLLEATLTASLIMVGILAAARICGVHIFWAEWWPVWLAWSAIALASWSTTVSAGGGLDGIWRLSATMILVCIGWMALAAAFAFASKAVCDAGLTVSAQSMRWLAVGFRRTG